MTLYLQGNRLLFALIAQGLAPSGTSSAYAVWLTGPGDAVRRLGFATAGRDDSLGIQGPSEKDVAAFPKLYPSYANVVVSRESRQDTRRPGRVVLSGKLPPAAEPHRSTARAIPSSAASSCRRPARRSITPPNRAQPRGAWHSSSVSSVPPAAGSSRASVSEARSTRANGESGTTSDQRRSRSGSDASSRWSARTPRPPGLPSTVVQACGLTPSTRRTSGHQRGSEYGSSSTRHTSGAGARSVRERATRTDHSPS